MTPERIALLSLAGAWTLLALYGLRMAWQNRETAWANLRALGDNANGRRRVGLADIRRETLRVVIMADFAAIGIIAALLEPSSFRSGLTSCALILAVLMHVLLIRLDRTESRALLADHTDYEALRDASRDEGRDLVRDAARDIARDLEHDAS